MNWNTDDDDDVWKANANRRLKNNRKPSANAYYTHLYTRANFAALDVCTMHMAYTPTDSAYIVFKNNLSKTVV